MPKAPFLVATLPDHLAPGDLRLGGRGRVALGERGGRPPELVFAPAFADQLRTAELQEQVRIVGERRVEDDRLLEETGRRLRCAEGPGALPGLPQGLRGPGQELLDV